MLTTVRTLRFPRIGIIGRALRLSISSRISPVRHQNRRLRQVISHHQITAGMVGVLARPDPGPHRGPAPLTRRWILVGNPPLEWPGASFGVPLLRPPHDDGRGSRCCRPSGACRVQFPRGSSRVQNVLPQPRQGPAAELTADRGPFAELFGQVAPGRTASCSPENTIQNKTMIRGLTPMRVSDGTNKAFEEGPLTVGYQVARQAPSPTWRWSLNHRASTTGIHFANTN